MASNHVLLSALVMLSILAAAVATIACKPGVGIPPKPLPSCRAYVVQQTCKDTQQTTPSKVASKDPCCRELEAVSEECRCTAMEDFMQGMLRLEGVPEGCTRNDLWEFTMSLVKPETCNLKTITGGPYCGLPPSDAARLADGVLDV